MNREAWLMAAVEAVKPLFPNPENVPPVRVSVGFPGGRGKKAGTIGQCWGSKASEDGIPHIFIHPSLTDPVEVLGVLIHELVHAVDDCQNGHKAPFAAIAREVGLEGKMTATVVSEPLRQVLESEVLPKLGEYPHAALSTTSKPGTVQTTRMLKVVCLNDTGYLVRMTQKWLDLYGPPACPCCDETMEVAA